MLINVNMNKESFLILESSLKRILGERKCFLSPGEGYVIKVEVNDSLKDDRYIIRSGDCSIYIEAACDCAVFAAVQHFLLDSSFNGAGEFIPYTGCLDFTPKNSLRGMYFATHFDNFYHKAPIEKIYRVVEDLAFRGCNALLVWYDMHHYRSIDDPESAAMIIRLKDILGYARRIGIKTSLLMIGNEGFSGTPDNLRADYHVQGNYRFELCGHYHVEICPSKDGGLEEILRCRRQVLEAFSDIDISYIVFWPYDQGGCTCKDCEPWGVNGFLRIYPHFRDLVREIMPGTSMILSTWLFDRFISGEWDQLYKVLKNGDIEPSYIMSFFFNGELPECISKYGVPENVRFIDFPEISMYLCSPWGGFGANPLSMFLQRTFEGTKGFFSGGFPYSEGIFEDINKWIVLSMYNGIYDNTTDAVRGYVKFEFCTEDELLTDAIIRTENYLYRNGYSYGKMMNYEITNTSDIEYVYNIITEWDSRLPEGIRKSFKWRLIYLRAVIDYELLKNDFIPLKSQKIQAALKELCEMYYTTGNTNPWVKPPLGV